MFKMPSHLRKIPEQMQSLHYIQFLSQNHAHPISHWDLLQVFGDNGQFLTDKRAINRLFRQHVELDKTFLPDHDFSNAPDFFKNYSEHSYSRLKMRTANARASLAHANENLMRSLEIYMRLKTQARYKKANLAKEFFDQMTQFAAKNKHLKIYFTREWLEIVTPPITLNNDDAAAQFSVTLGGFIIKFNAQRCYVYAMPDALRTETSHYHPYISSDGAPCFGERSNDYIKALDNFDFVRAIEMTLELLQSYNSVATPYASLARFAESAAQKQLKHDGESDE